MLMALKQIHQRMTIHRKHSRSCFLKRLETQGVFYHPFSKTTIYYLPFTTYHEHIKSWQNPKPIL